MKRNNKKRNQRERQKEKKVIRCSIVNRPVFEYETCPEFKLKPNSVSGAQQNCKNCIHSF